MGRRVLALEPYYGGSHKAFLDSWAARSAHTWTILGLPPYKWKWRMRHSAITFADAVRERLRAGEAWDVVWASDMLNLAEFRGLAPPPVGTLPSVLYFHENQLTYPVRQEAERDLHFGFTNITAALAADQVWFNSDFHRTEFLAAVEGLVARMPNHRPAGAPAAILNRSAVWPPGIEECPAVARRAPGRLHILSVARWEYDKGPEVFFAALRRLQSRGVPFCLSVLGERFAEAPAAYAEAAEGFRGMIRKWGFVDSREAYWRVLAEADVVVSTATHEFFGMGVLEAVTAGCFPVVPEGLAYPEVLGQSAHPEFFYRGGPEALADRLAALASIKAERGTLWEEEGAWQGVAAPYQWSRLAPRLDAALEGLLMNAL